MFVPVLFFTFRCKWHNVNTSGCKYSIWHLLFFPESHMAAGSPYPASPYPAGQYPPPAQGYPGPYPPPTGNYPGPYSPPAGNPAAYPSPGVEQQPPPYKS